MGADRPVAVNFTASKILEIFEKRYPGQADVDELIEKMFRSEPFDELGPWVWNEMRRYPSPVLQLLERNRLRLIVVAPHTTRRGAHYEGRARTVRVEPNQIYSGYPVLVHELAHAIDDALTQMVSAPARLSISLWHEFKEQRAGFVSDYAESSPSEYFAESVTYFIMDDGWSLERCDPGMHRFVNGLLSPRGSLGGGGLLA